MKRFLLLTLTMLLTSCSTFAAKPRKVLMVINEGFQVDEYFVPRQLFEEAGYEIKTASRFGGLVNPGRKYINTHNPVQADMTFTEINVNDYDAITFAGGGGAWSDYFPDKNIHKVLLAATQRQDMIVGLICAATGLLATAQNLDGSTPQFKNRRVTGYDEVAGLLMKQGQVNYEAGKANEPHVVVDENLVTGRDPMSSKLFAETVIKLLR